MIGAGIVYTPPTRTFASLRLRYFGPTPITQDGTVYSPPNTTVEVQAGYKVDRDDKVGFQIFNLFNIQADDIAYDYEYRLTPTSPPSTGVDFHPTQPRSYVLFLSKDL